VLVGVLVGVEVGVEVGAGVGVGVPVQEAPCTIAKQFVDPPSQSVSK
jgi:hypothetical protein